MHGLDPPTCLAVKGTEGLQPQTQDGHGSPRRRGWVMAAVNHGRPPWLFGPAANLQPGRGIHCAMVVCPENQEKACPPLLILPGTLRRSSLVSEAGRCLQEPVLEI